MTEIIRADLHQHLRTSSRFREGDFDRAVNVAYKRLGQGGVLGLVNFDDHRYEDFIGLRGYDREDIGNAVYVPERDILVVKGQEIQTVEGHLLVLAIPKNVHLRSGRNITLEYALKEKNERNGIGVLVHGWYWEGAGPYLMKHPELIEEPYGIDAIEVENGGANLWLPFLTPRKANKKAQEYFLELRKENPHLGALASGDGHSFYEIGFVYTEIPRPVAESSETLSTTLKEGVRGASLNDTCRLSLISPLIGMIGGFDHFVDLVVLNALSKPDKR